jgi:hypothetical protein
MRRVATRPRAIRMLKNANEPLPHRSAQRRPANRLGSWNSAAVELDAKPSSNIPTERGNCLIRRRLSFLSRTRGPLLLRVPFGIMTRGERASFVRINSARDGSESELLHFFRWLPEPAAILDHVMTRQFRLWLGLSSRLRHDPTISGSAHCIGGIRQEKRGQWPRWRLTPVTGRLPPPHFSFGDFS